MPNNFAGIKAPVSRGFSAFLALAALCLALFLISGCVPSPTLTEILYRQDEQYEIDPDAPKIIKNVPDAEEEQDDLPALKDSTGESDNVTEDLPKLGEQENEQQVQQSQTHVGNTENAAPQQVAGADGDWSDITADGDGALNDEGVDGSTSTGGGPNEDDANAGKEEGGDSGQTGTTPGATFSDIGDNDELPEGVKSVAAVGNAAIVVAALGGEDGEQNLVAANEGLLGNYEFQTVMASKLSCGYVISEVSAPLSLWSGDGSAAGSIDATGFEQLLNLQPDACLISEGEETFTSDQVDQLVSAGINVVYVPSMTTPDKVKACVNRIGALLGKGGDSSAENLSATYESFHDRVMNQYSDADSTYYSLYISNWETGVTYTRNPRRDAWLATPQNGVAVTAVGKSARVPGLYMKAGGVINAASQQARFRSKEGKAIVWQAAGGTLLNEWSQSGRTSGINGVTVELPSSSGFSESSLTCVTVGSTVYKLGTEAFPAVIVDTWNVKSLLDADRARTDGLYHYYDPFEQGGAGSISTSIASADYDVLVNPHGLFSSWTGGSIESVLEAPWVYQQFNADEVAAQYLADVTAELYATFYGYSPADFSNDFQAILDATYASGN